jgi:thioredoxin 1
VIEIKSQAEWDAQMGSNPGKAVRGIVFLPCCHLVAYRCCPLYLEYPFHLMQVIVDFSATWCGPCRMIGPEFAKLSEEFTSVVFLKVDVDQVESVASKCGISAMPTFQVFKDGQKVDELVGASKDKLKELIAKWA